MKRIIALILVVLSICAFAVGCAPNNIVNPDSTVDETSPSETKEVSVDSYDKTYKGFCKYLVDAKIVKGDPTEMQAELIGAAEGVRYQATVDKATFLIEVYSYPTDKSNEISKDVISQVEKSGEFKLDNLYTVPVPAVLSGSKQIMVVYNDNALESAGHKEAYDKFLKALAEF